VALPNPSWKHALSRVPGHTDSDLWAYPWTIAFLGVFIVHQVCRLSLKPSVGLTVLTIFDAAIAWLTWRESRKQLAVARR
jgi:uncharacterized membrane protein